MRKSTLVACTPHRETGRTSTPTSGNPSRRGKVSSHDGCTPASTSAPSSMSPLMPANGSRMAMRWASCITCKYRRSLAIKPPGPGVEKHHGFVPPNLATFEVMLERSQGGPALGGGVNRLARRQLSLRRAQLVIADGDGAAVGFPHGPEHQAPTQRRRNPEPGGHGDGVWPRFGAIRPGLERADYRGAAGGLHAIQARDLAVEPLGRPQPPERPP